MRARERRMIKKCKSLSLSTNDAYDKSSFAGKQKYKQIWAEAGLIGDNNIEMPIP